MYSVDGKLDYPELFEVTYESLNGIPIDKDLSCAYDHNEPTGYFTAGTVYQTGFTQWGQPCGFDVTYTWLGDAPLTFTVNFNSALQRLTTVGAVAGMTMLGSLLF